MPWQETDPVDQRERFITDHQHELYSMAELCARYGISRKTGYKWLARYDAFRAEYNTERPHAVLGGQPPASRYVASPRPYPARLPPLEYPAHFLVKRVTNAGTFRFKHRLLFIANALKQHHIGLEESTDGIWSIYLGRVLLARLDERDHVIRG
jgi:hypothetical protein